MPNAPFDPHQYLLDHLAESLAVIDVMFGDEEFCRQVVAIADVIATAFKSGNKLLICGNGGSAADAQHIAAEFVGRYGINREPMSAIALTTDGAVLTAVSNDWDYNAVFTRQIWALKEHGDVLLCLSASGTSPSVVSALDSGRLMRSILITGASKLAFTASCDYVLRIPSTKTPIIQQATMVVMHAVCGIVERTLYG